MISSAEAFVNNEGEIGGFSALFCEWLTRLFGIRFDVQIIELSQLLESYLGEVEEIDFLGDFKATEERMRIFFMTDPIAMRWIKSVRIEGSQPLSVIAQSRPIRYAFLQHNAAIDEVAAVLDPGSYESIIFSTGGAGFDGVYQMLKYSDADAFVMINPAEAAFDNYDDVIIEDFMPLIFSSVSMSTRKPELEPFISVVNKAIRSGATGYLAQLYSKGYQEYFTNKLFKLLTEEERQYIKSAGTVKLGVQNNHYPIGFYNPNESEWQGIIFDLLKEVNSLTGLSFEVGNDIETSWIELLTMLDNGDVAFTPQLVRTPEREGRLIWPKTAPMKDRYILISKLDFPELKANEIFNIRTGLVRGFSHTSVFHSWFPNHSHTVEYASFDDVIDGLDNNEVDVLMGSIHQLLAITNFHERSGFTANYLFNSYFDVGPAFNINETILLSIIEKAFQLIDIDGISEPWMLRIFDYKIKVAQERLSWIYGIAVAFMIVFAIFYKYII
jgi:ABC-type amino acid transport substrate-binding protein